MRRSQRVRKFISPLQPPTNVNNSRNQENASVFIEDDSILQFIDTQVELNLAEHQGSRKGLLLTSPANLGFPSPSPGPVRKKFRNVNLNDALSESSLNLSNVSEFIYASQLPLQSSSPVNLFKDDSIRCFGQRSPSNADELANSRTSIANNPLTPVQDEHDSDFIEVEITQFTPRVAERFITRIKSGTVQTSQRTGAQYVQRQRSMAKQNEENVIDDDICNVSSNQQITSQYQRELEQEFVECEQSILKNLTNTSSGEEQLFNGLSKIDWDEDLAIDVPKKPLQTQTSHGGVKLAPVSSTNFAEMGPFFGLPLKVKELIKEFKGIDDLYDWQKECLRLKTILQRHNLIYALPTSGGKTLVAEILMLREVICRKKNVLFILPFVSIVQEKVLSLSPFAVNLEFLVEEYAAGKGNVPPKKRRKKNSIFIATIEKGLALMDALIEEKRAEEIGLIVVDELHMIGERGRGGTLESLLTKAMIIDCGIQIVGMSATIGNLNELAEFLNADIYSRDFRPVELKEYVKVGVDLFEVNQLASGLDEAFEPAKVLQYDYSAEMARSDPDHLTALVAEEIPLNSVLIFCPTKENCANVSKLLCKFLSAELLNHRQDERLELINSIQRDVGDICPVLKQTIPFGIAYHHSGLTADERKHIEDAYRLGILCVICCTSTLAAGVNLPAKRVILRSPFVGREFITLSKYKQMVGRAGRAGQTENNCGESILICKQGDFQRVCDLLFSPMDEANSSLAITETSGLQSFVLSSIDLGLGSTRDDVQKLAQKTLLFLQSQRLGVDLKLMVDSILRELYKSNAISTKTDRGLLKPKNLSVLIESQNSFSQSIISCLEPTTNTCINPNKAIIKIKGKTELQVSRLGKAAIKACITLSRAELMYKDLEEAKRHLVLTDYLHLLYLTTPYDLAENMTPNPQIYHNAYVELSETESKTAGVIGLTQARAVKLMSRKQFDAETNRKLKRFFITLILYDLWKGKNVNEVDRKFSVGRGTVQTLMTQAATTASSVLRFCEELEEFWAFKQLFDVMTKRLQHCCSMELMPLMDLPAVKLARAKQLYAAGFKKLEDIAVTAPSELIRKVENMNNKVARQLIAAAKALLFEKVEDLRGEMQEVMENLRIQ